MADEIPDAPDGRNRMQEAMRARQSSYDTRDHARMRMSGATRAVITDLLSTTADESVLGEAADLVDRAVALLAERPHGRLYEGRPEGSLGDQSRADLSPIVGAMNPVAPPMSLDLVDDRVIGTVVYGPQYEGPPGCVHGGIIAAGFDELLGFAQSLSGRPGMTGRLEISYRSPTPLLQELRYEGWMTDVDGRKIFTAATLCHGDTLCAEATGLFISMKPNVMMRLLSSRIGGFDGEG
ncbi:MAG: PaaI family thioesterase [Acidimicrobiia bacterium]